MKTNKNDRRNFLKMLALGTGSLVAFTISEKVLAQVVPLGGGDGTPVSEPVCPPPKPPAAMVSAITRNHGHEFLLTLEELKANGAKTYSIKGASGHPHSIDITTDVLLALLIHNVVDVESTKDAGHTHVVKLTII